jgi:hypothetical protein
MKKSILFMAVICFALTAAKAQLAFTSWSGTAHLLQEDKTLIDVKIKWDFRKDTVLVIFPGNGLPEILTYAEKDNTVTFAKVSGDSPCAVGSGAKYKFEIKDDKLYFTLLESNCEAFSKALDDKPFTRVKMAL